MSTTLTIVSLALMTYAGFHLSQLRGRTKVLGWTAAWQQASWSVKEVDPTGPAAGRLQPGDRVLAIDSDTRAQRLGPIWFLRDRPNEQSYSIRVSRGATEIEQHLDWPTHPDLGMQLWSWVHLATGAVFLAVGLILAFARPDIFVGRRGLECGVLSGFFFTFIALRGDNSMLSGTGLLVAMAMFCVVPYHVLAGYRFSARYPTNERSTGGWRVFEIFLYVAAFLVWLPGAYTAALRAFGPEHAIARATNHYPYSVYAELFYQPFGVLFGTICGAGVIAVCWRNYQRVREPDLRRRIRWMFLGMGSTLFPVVLLSPLLLFIASPATRANLIHLVNTFALICPTCIAYAVFKHRVLGIRVVLRAGIQYLLAKNVLRFALAVPALIILATAVANPQLTLAQLALGPIGKLDFLLLVLTILALKYRTTLLNRIDRHFFREAYRRDQVFEALSEAVRRAADIPEISRLLSTEIQAALHPRAIFAVSREGEDDFCMVYSSSQEGSRSVQDFGVSATSVAGVESSVDVRSLGAAEFAALQALGIELMVPIRAPNEGLVGLLLLGPKMSEEAYSRTDRTLLDMVATQTGIAWENLELRKRLQREREVRRKVTANIDGGKAPVVMECPRCGACFDGDAVTCSEDGRALTPTLPIARTIESKYLLTRLLGIGGMGAVYKAKDLRLDRSVAVKVMIGDLFGHSTALQRFAREARASAKIDHPNVVRIFDFGELSGGGAYLVLELLRGSTLRRELHRRGALPPGEVTPLLFEIFHGVEAAHQRHIIHRDLKPDNIFLARESENQPPVAKILDFGLAVVRDLEFTGGHRLTQPGNAVGTLAYMSQEQFLGEEVDERTDVYSLGIVALEVLTGEVRLRGPWFSQLEPVVQERLCGPASSSVHQQIAEVLKRSLSEDRKQRYSSVREFREALLPLVVEYPNVPVITAQPNNDVSSAETLIGELGAASHPPEDR